MSPLPVTAYLSYSADHSPCVQETSSSKHTPFKHETSSWLVLITYNTIVRNSPSKYITITSQLRHHGCRQQLRPFIQDDQVRQHSRSMDVQPMPLWTVLVDI